MNSCIDNRDYVVSIIYDSWSVDRVVNCICILYHILFGVWSVSLTAVHHNYNDSGCPLKGMRLLSNDILGLCVIAYIQYRNFRWTIFLKSF